MSIANSEEYGDINNNKRKRPGEGQSMASDSGHYTGDAAGELLSSSITTTKTKTKS